MPLARIAARVSAADLPRQSTAEAARRAFGTGWTRELGCGVLDAGAALELATGVTQTDYNTGTLAQPQTLYSFRLR